MPVGDKLTGIFYVQAAGTFTTSPCIKQLITEV